MKKPETRKLQPIRPKLKDTNFSSYEKARLVYLYRQSKNLEENESLKRIAVELGRTFESVLREAKIRKSMGQI